MSKIFFYLLFLSAAKAAEPHVILVTIDGVRYQEFFNGIDKRLSMDSRPVLPYLWEKLLNEGAVFGAPETKNRFYISNRTKISLPAYFSIFAGYRTKCSTNDCENTREPTLIDALFDRLNLLPSEVATIASWDKIERAVEALPHQSFIRSGNIEHLRAEETPPWGGAQYDKYTRSQAINYIKTYAPRFMYVSFDDPDEWAHLHHYENYIKSIREFDAWLRELDAVIWESEALKNNTTVLLTTDHGRGRSTRTWHDHGGWTASSRVWLYAKGPFVRARGKVTKRGSYHHADLRPTIECLFGFQANEPKIKGKIISEIVDPKNCGAP